MTTSTMEQELRDIEEQLAAAHETAARASERVRTALELRDQMRSERMGVQSDVAAAAARAGALDELRAKHVAAIAGYQDACVASAKASGEVDRLTKARGHAIAEVGREHLVALLDQRQALAGQLEAALELVVALAPLYLETARAANGMAEQLGLVALTHDPEPALARRILARIRSTAPQELRELGSHREGPLVASDLELTRGIRERLEATS